MRLFYSYAHEDEELRKKLEKHLSPLRNQGAIDDWFDGDLSAGTEWDAEIKERLNTADIILLLVSVDFLSSDYIWRVEIEKAMQRHQAKEARVIPIVLRPCDWQNSPFGKLQALPKNAKPITKWDDKDEAFLDVVEGIKTAINSLEDAEIAIKKEDAEQRKENKIEKKSNSGRGLNPEFNRQSSPATTVPLAAHPFASEFLQQCEQELARYIGPMASLILEDTLAENPQFSSQQLIKALAKEIPNPQQAKVFIQNLLLAICDR